MRVNLRSRSVASAGMSSAALFLTTIACSGVSLNFLHLLFLCMRKMRRPWAIQANSTELGRFTGAKIFTVTSSSSPMDIPRNASRIVWKSSTSWPPLVRRDNAWDENGFSTLPVILDSRNFTHGVGSGLAAAGVGSVASCFPSWWIL